MKNLTVDIYFWIVCCLPAFSLKHYCSKLHKLTSKSQQHNKLCCVDWKSHQRTTLGQLFYCDAKLVWIQKYLSFCFCTWNSVCWWLFGASSWIDGLVVEPDMSAGFCPDHKAAMVLFLDRVYGIEDQNFLLHLLEVGFLPDLRAAASLDTVSVFLDLFTKFACILTIDSFIKS